jgi:FkbM family methyltransferase
MKKLLRSLLETVGLEPTIDRASSGRFMGMDLRLKNSPFLFQRGFAKVSADGESFVFLVLNPNDLIQREHAEGRLYEMEELQIIKKHFSGGTFLDVGSNVGNHAVYAAKVLKASKVIAVEPNPVALNILKCNIALNDLQDNVRPLAVGLSDRPGRVSLDTPSLNNLGRTRLAHALTDGSVEIVTGDSIFRDEPIHFVKIDVEGHELRVIAGLRQLIDRWRPPLFVEVDEANYSAFPELVERLGYQVVEKYSRYPENTNYLIVAK